MTSSEKKSDRNKNYYELNKNKIKQRQKEWRSKNPDYHKKYYESNPEKFIEYSQSENKKQYIESHREENRERTKKWIKNNSQKAKEYYSLNKESLNKKKRENYHKRKKDPLFRLKINIRSLIRQSIKRQATHKSIKTLAILGCSFQDFKEHIEKQFEPWMNWENYGSYKSSGIRTWNFDHIIPLSSATTEQEMIKLNHYTNLRPLCSKQNLDKRSSIISL